MDFLAAHAEDYAQLALLNIEREFPAGVAHTMTAPGDFPHRPRERNPAFFGSYDWHSCVEMHWTLVRLLRLVPEHVRAGRIRAALDVHLAPEPLAAEARFMAERTDAARERPYGWGWGLALAHEVAALGGADGARWAAHLQPLADVLCGHFVDWLGAATYPVRHGLHPNSAFGMDAALPYARARAAQGDPALLAAIEDAATRWFAGDTDYPARYEPSGHDFLSPALTEAVLMARLLEPERFTGWFGAYLPGLAGGEPGCLLDPVTVGDSSDGQTAHLHGLNLSRAWALRVLSGRLPRSDERQAPIRAAAERHAQAALPHVTGEHYMVEHWLVCYAVLYLTAA